MTDPFWVNPRACTRPNPNLALQNIDFSQGFRASAAKLVVIITDAEPGGFCDVGDGGAMAHQYALQARSNCVKINAIQVELEGNTLDAAAKAVMLDYQTDHLRVVLGCAAQRSRRRRRSG